MTSRGTSKLSIPVKQQQQQPPPRISRGRKLSNGKVAPCDKMSSTSSAFPSRFKLDARPRYRHFAFASVDLSLELSLATF